MGVLKAILFVASITCFQIAQSSPISKTELHSILSERAPDDADNTDYLTKAGVNCLIAQDPDCWDVLKMDDYVHAWLNGPKGQLCGTQGLAEGFGDCFVDSYRITPRCSTITVESCADSIAAIANQLTTSDVATGPISTLEKRQFFIAAYNIKSSSAPTESPLRFQNLSWSILTKSW